MIAVRAKRSGRYHKVWSWNEDGSARTRCNQIVTPAAGRRKPATIEYQVDADVALQVCEAPRGYLSVPLCGVCAWNDGTWRYNRDANEFERML